MSLRCPSVVNRMLKFKNCAGAEEIQGVDSEHDMNMTDSWWTANALNTADTEEYRRRTLHTLNAADTELTLNTIDSEPHNWILDWTLLTLNNSRQTMNAADSHPANTEHHWLCMLQILPYDWMLKKTWTDDWTLLALNAIELNRRYRLTLTTVYTESYWYINSAELTLHWTLHNTERANCSERYT